MELVTEILNQHGEVILTNVEFSGLAMDDLQDFLYGFIVKASDPSGRPLTPHEIDIKNRELGLSPRTKMIFTPLHNSDYYEEFEDETDHNV